MFEFMVDNANIYFIKCKKKKIQEETGLSHGFTKITI